jgi:hypothetical protein
MKKELLAAVVAVLLLLAGVGYYGFSWLAEPRPRKYVELPPLPKELREMEKQLAADNKGGAKGQIAPADLPPEILKLIKELLPDAVITEAVRDKKDKFKLKLAWNGKTLIASLRFTDRDVRGDIKENLNPQDLPAAIAAAFKQAAPAGTIDKLCKVTEVGGSAHGQARYEWEWGKNADAEAATDGSLLKLKDELATSELPLAVAESVNQAFPQGSLDKKADRINENGQVSYIFDVRPADGGKKVEVQVRANGEIIRRN